MTPLAQAPERKHTTLHASDISSVDCIDEIGQFSP